jgi:hypothetical protein
MRAPTNQTQTTSWSKKARRIWWKTPQCLKPEQKNRPAPNHDIPPFIYGKTPLLPSSMYGPLDQPPLQESWGRERFCVEVDGIVVVPKGQREKRRHQGWFERNELDGKNRLPHERRKSLAVAVVVVAAAVVVTAAATVVVVVVEAAAARRKIRPPTQLPTMTIPNSSRPKRLQNLPKIVWSLTTSNRHHHSVLILR